MAIATNISTIRDCLSYDPATGAFIWLKTVNSRALKGSEAGVIVNRRGIYYRVITFLGKKHYAHRLAVFLVTGEWPIRLIDHEDGDGLNNRWGNIRQATGSQNSANSRRQKRNTSGFKGVFFNKRCGKFFAKISVRGRPIYLGTSDSAELAAASYDTAAHYHFGAFAKLNFPEEQSCQDY